MLKDKYYGKFKIIRKENYFVDENSDIVPFDFILGWNKMSILYNVNLIKFSQSNRWYYWHIDSFDEITRTDIEENSANTHIIPYNKNIENKLKSISINNDAILIGYLVDIKKGEKIWASSETRTDIGAGACEIFLVTDIK